MKNDNMIATLYFDDMQIVGRIVRVNCGESVTPLVTVRKEYTGISESNFNDPIDFMTTVNTILVEMVKGVSRIPATLYIGVSNQFCQVQTQSSAIAFDHVTKINRHHIETLWNEIAFDTSNACIIKKKALYYKLEEYDEVFINGYKDKIKFKELEEYIKVH